MKLTVLAVVLVFASAVIAAPKDEIHQHLVTYHVPSMTTETCAESGILATATHVASFITDIRKADTTVQKHECEQSCQAECKVKGYSQHDSCVPAYYGCRCLVGKDAVPVEEIPIRVPIPAVTPSAAESAAIAAVRPSPTVHYGVPIACSTACYSLCSLKGLIVKTDEACKGAEPKCVCLNGKAALIVGA